MCFDLFKEGLNMNVEIKQLPMDEYNSLKSEIINRINIMNTQASTAISLIIAIWAAGFGLLGIQLSNLEDLSMAQNLALSFGQIGVFILSNVILLPMAIKSGENLRQMVSLGAYIQVFFEYLSHKNGLPTQFTWETSDKAINSVINSKEYRCRDYLFNSKYTILGIISLLFILIEIPLNYSFSNHVIDNVPLAIIYVAVILFSVFLIWKIYCYSSSKKNINIM